MLGYTLRLLRAQRDSCRVLSFRSIDWTDVDQGSSSRTTDCQVIAWCEQARADKRAFLQLGDLHRARRVGLDLHDGSAANHCRPGLANQQRAEIRIANVKR